MVSLAGSNSVRLWLALDAGKGLRVHLIDGDVHVQMAGIGVNGGKPLVLAKSDCPAKLILDIL